MAPLRRTHFVCVLCLLAALAGRAPAAELDPSVRAAVVRVEVAVDPASSGPALMRELAAEAHPSAFSRELLRRLRTGAVGTGFFVNSDGYLVTNAHVILSGVRYRNLKFTQNEWDSLRTTLVTFRDIWITVGEGEEARDYLATPVAIAESCDLALLKVQLPPNSSPAFRCLPISRSAGLHVGDFICSLGFPNYAFQESQGRILSLIQGRQVHEEMQLVERVDPATQRKIVTVSGTNGGPIMRLQHDAPTGHGSSGGPLLNDRGCLIGVAYALLSETAPDGNTSLRTDLNLGIASDVLVQLLKQNNVRFTEAPS